MLSRIAEKTNPSLDTTFTRVSEYGRWIIFKDPVVTTQLRYTHLTGTGTLITEFEAYHVDQNRRSTMAASTTGGANVAMNAGDDYLPSAWGAATNLSSTGYQFNNSWVATDMGVARSANRAVISEYGNRTSAFKIQYKLAGVWTDAYTGATIGPWKTVTFPAVTAQEWRLLFTGGTAGTGPIIYEFSLYRD